jgi:hypothetical protein
MTTPTTASRGLVLFPLKAVAIHHVGKDRLAVEKADRERPAILGFLYAKVRNAT